MTPFEQAAEWHAASGCGLSFTEVIEAHAQVGFVHITPEIFLLARHGRSYWPDTLRDDPWHVATDGDCWHVWLMAGDWCQWERFLPYPLPFVSMHRREVLRVWPLDRLRRGGMNPAVRVAGSGSAD